MYFFDILKIRIRFIYYSKVLPYFPIIQQTEDVINREVMKKLSHHEHEQIMANEAARKANTVQFYEKVCH